MTDNYPSEPYPASGAGVTGVPPTNTTPPVVGAPPVGGVYGTDSTSSSSDSGSSTTGTAKEQAANVGGTAKESAQNVASTAKDSAQNVASTAKDEAGKVASTAKRQAKDLVHETRSQLTEQAGAQQQKVATGLHSLSDELHGMADASSEPGIAADLVSQAAARAGSVATWLEDRDPGTLLEDVKDFARRKPGTFIAVAAVAGVLAGRLTRSLVSEAKESAEAEASTPTDDTTTTGYADSTEYTATGGYTAAGPADTVGGVAPTTPVYGSQGYGSTPTGAY